MKRRFILSIALVLSIVLVSLMSSDSKVNAEPPQIYSFRTSLNTLGDGVILRVTAVSSAGNDGSTARVRFKWTKYMEADCDGDGVCRYTIDSQGSTPATALGNDALSFDVPGNGDLASILIESNSRNIRVTAMIIGPDGEVNAFLVNMDDRIGE